jgi:CubicO group peptidase (beta-lactamase class C family)
MPTRLYLPTRRGFLLGLLAAPALPGQARAVPRAPARRMKDPLEPAYALLDEAVKAGQVRAAVLQVQAGKTTYLRAFGTARTRTVFLLASITKPMTAAAVMALVEAGKLSLDEPAQKHVPELAGADRARITVRNLLDHTSGLPDMPPDNQALRDRHAPLSEFLASACRAPLLFQPGSAVKYQSMGFLVAATIVERLTGLPFREHLRRVLLAPLELAHTSLGLGGRAIADTAACQVPDEPGGWNSPYWRDLGSPWGGAHGTTADIVHWLRFFANPATAGSLRPETVRAMLTPSGPTTTDPARTPTPSPRRDRYGLGFRLGLGGKGCSEQTFGHGGATGCLAWMDPTRDLTFALLTTWPASQSQSALLTPVSDQVAAALVK